MYDAYNQAATVSDDGFILKGERKKEVEIGPGTYKVTIWNLTDNKIRYTVQQPSKLLIDEGYQQRYVYGGPLEYKYIGTIASAGNSIKQITVEGFGIFTLHCDAQDKAACHSIVFLEKI